MHGSSYKNRCVYSIIVSNAVSTGRTWVKHHSWQQWERLAYCDWRGHVQLSAQRVTSSGRENKMALNSVKAYPPAWRDHEQMCGINYYFNWRWRHVVPLFPLHQIRTDVTALLLVWIPGRLDSKVSSQTQKQYQPRYVCWTGECFLIRPFSLCFKTWEPYKLDCLYLIFIFNWKL